MTNNNTPHQGQTTGPACVYTALFGGYEALNEQPVRHESDLRFICFTDDPTLKSETWDIVLVDPIFPMDPVRSQRVYKMLPDRYLPEYGASLYIDNSVVLKKPPEVMLRQQLSESDFVLPSHSYRQTVLDEFLEVVRLGLDDANRVFEQLNQYALIAPAVLEEKPHWCGMLFRRHGNPQVRETMNLWLSHVYRYSRRDQLSFNFCCDATGFAPGRLSLDNYNSDFHEWPVHSGRDRSRERSSLPASLVPIQLQLRRETRLHQETRELLRSETEFHQHARDLLGKEITAHKRTQELLMDETASHAGTRENLDQITSSLSWRWTEPLRKALHATTQGSEAFKRLIGRG